MPRVSAMIRSRTCSSSANAHRRAQQRAGVAVHESAHLEIRHVLELVAGLACGEHEPDRLGQQPARDEGERQRRGSDPATARRPRRTAAGRPSAASDTRLRTARPTRNRSGGGPALKPKTIWSASRCGAGQPLEPIEQRSAQLMQAREGQLHLGLDPRRARRRSGPTPTRPGTRAGPSSRFPPRPAGPASGSRPGGRRRADRPAGRTRPPARAGSCAAPGRGIRHAMRRMRTAQSFP